MATQRVKTAEAFVREWCSNAKEGGGGEITADFMGMAQVVLYPNKDAWREGRRMTLGASDVPTVMGLTDGWRTAKQLYQSKIDGSTDCVAENDDIRIGVESEPLIRELYAVEHSDLEVYDGSNMTFISRDLPFASCSLDAIVVKGDTISDLEIKCGRYSDKWKGGYLPDNYFVQLLWQSLVTGIEDIHLIARLRFMDGEVSEKHYRYDAMNDDFDEQRQALIRPCEEFWRMVEEKNYFPKSIRI